MSNSVDILIKADDKASASLRKVNDSLKQSADAFKQSTANAKKGTDAIGAFASITGSSELAGFASGIAGVTEKISGLAEVAKAGGTSSMAFKASVAGLVGTLAFGLGRVLADVIWKTASFEKSMEMAGKQAKRLDSSIAELQTRLVAQQKEDIELIQNPEEKAAAQKALIDSLNKEIDSVSKNVSHSRKQVLEWAEAWKITGNQKQYAKDAEEQLELDEQKLAALKKERDEIARNTSERQKQIEAIRKTNDERAKSKAYVDDLRREVEYMKASKEEQRQLDAMRNSAFEDRGEAERLLAERDAIIAKNEAEKKAEEERLKIAEEKQREADRQKQEQDREIKRLEDMKQSERDRLEIQKIEIEQGKEAARVKELMNQGIDEKTAKEFAAEEKRLEELKEKRSQKPKAVEAQKLSALETRLLTRGSSEDQSLVLQRQMTLALKSIQTSTDATAKHAEKQSDALKDIKDNTKQNVKIQVPQ